MPTSVIENGKVKDIIHKRLGDTVTAVYLADEYIGQTHKMWNGYSCFLHISNPLGVVSGFKTRWQATQFLIQIRKVYKPKVKVKD